MPKITPFLWFDGHAEEAATFYVSIFNGSKILDISRSGGSVASVRFELEGQPLIAFNGGPHFTFTPAISLFVSCETQDEVDTLWDKLVAGGRPQRCGWLQDRYGLSWQIIPTILGTLLLSEDPGTASRALTAMLTMERLDIAALQKAAEQL